MKKGMIDEISFLNIKIHPYYSIRVNILYFWKLSDKAIWLIKKFPKVFSTFLTLESSTVSNQALRHAVIADID